MGGFFYALTYLKAGLVSAVLVSLVVVANPVFAHNTFKELAIQRGTWEEVKSTIFNKLPNSPARALLFKQLREVPWNHDAYKSVRSLLGNMQSYNNNYVEPTVLNAIEAQIRSVPRCQ